MPDLNVFTIYAIGYLRSTLCDLDDAPRQGTEGAPDAWLELDDAYRTAMNGIAVGDELVVIAWLHRADRNVLEVHPRGETSNPLAGVFATRSPHRPNPLGLHRVTVRAIDGTRLLVGPIETIDGTPVVDVKIALPDD